MPPRLHPSVLAQLPDRVARPSFDRSACTAGIVHLGLGAFSKAHVCVYADEVLRRGDTRWAITGVGLQTPSAKSQLDPQGGLFTVGVRDGDAESLRVVGAVREVLFAPNDRVALQTALRAASVVTLTVTEKGYCLNPSSGQLDMAHPDIENDLRQPHAPNSAIGWLGLAVRERASGDAPLTIVSCDNLSENGSRLEHAVRDYLEAVAPEAARWAQSNVAFPNTMVDRIVPKSTPEDVDATASLLGALDAGCVKTEPFSQWFIEDRFVGERPDWASAGANVVDSVLPYEAIKLRLLNGAHSTIAYAGSLLGFETVDQAMADPEFAAYIDALMRIEVAPTLEVPRGFDVSGYIDALQSRFANTALAHKTEQIAMDGSQKLPQRLIPAIAARLRTGEPFERLGLAVAAWVHYVTRGEPVADPIADRLAACAVVSDVEALLARVLGIREVFDAELAASQPFAACIERMLRTIRSQGVRAAIEAVQATRG